MADSDKKTVLLITKGGFPATDRRAWSGIPFSLKQQLEKQFNVVDYCINRKVSLLALVKTFVFRNCLKSFVSIQLLKSFAKKESKAVDKLIILKYNYIKIKCLVLIDNTNKDIIRLPNYPGYIYLIDDDSLSHKASLRTINGFYPCT